MTKNKDKSYSIKMESNEKVVKISDLKFNVITPVNMSCILGPVELSIFIALQHQCNVSNKPISLSMVASFTGLTKSRVSGNIKNLDKLGFVEIGRETKNGTFYYIRTEQIVGFLKDFNEIKDPVIRLQIGDLLRTFSGLETKNKSAIKLFAEYEKTGVCSIDKSFNSNDEDTFNVLIESLNNFKNINTNETWYKRGIKEFILHRIIGRAFEIGDIVGKIIDYNEQKEAYYGKDK